MATEGQSLVEVARDILTGRGRFKNSISNVSVRELIASQPGPLLLIRQRSSILSLRIIFTHAHTRCSSPVIQTHTIMDSCVR